ncbi:hypothetical protein PTTG_28207, partial [Puccinia triticina 1-1 BBBD Race 1]
KFFFSPPNIFSPGGEALVTPRPPQLTNNTGRPQTINPAKSQPPTIKPAKPRPHTVGTIQRRKIKSAEMGYRKYSAEFKYSVIRAALDGKTLAEINTSLASSISVDSLR